ncbi:MAG: LamG domain-containing protein [Chitinophagaceae bacterium]|nr:LamG domain-containing protein [Chitinophagaceae bacterium]
MLRSLFLMMVLFCTISTTAQTTAGLIAYFPFSGNYTNAGPANVTASGVSTSFTTNSCTAPNTAVQFQGNLNSYIDFIDNGNLDFVGTNNFTVSFNFFFNGNSTSGLVDNCLNYGGWGVWLWSTVAGTWNLQFNYKNNSVGSAAATNFTTGSWHHATAVRNNGTISLYIDGVFRLSATEGTTAPNYPINMQAGAMCYASFVPPRYNPFGGKIDELRIYNRALSAAEILVVSNAALNACCSNSSVLAVSGASTICAGGTANLTTTITGGVSPYTVVYTDGTTNFTVNNYVSGTNIPVTPSGTTSYSLVSVTDATACVGSGNSGNPTITVTPLPAATISYAGSPYCSNAGTATVTRTGTAGGTYSSTAGLTINATTGDVTLGTSTPGTYTVTYTIAASGGCSVVTATTTITITQLPAATISYAGSPYCSNAGTATVTRTGTAGGTYSSTAGLTINATTGDVTLGTSTPGTSRYTIAASGGCPVVTATNTTITIIQLPAATISYAGSPYCSNAGTANVTRTGTAGGTYSSTAGLTINAATGDVTLGTSTPGTYTVTYTIAASGGCSVVTATTTITITQLPAATISYTGSPYCSNAGTATVTRTEQQVELIVQQPA